MDELEFLASFQYRKLYRLNRTFPSLQPEVQAIKKPVKKTCPDFSPPTASPVQVQVSHPNLTPKSQLSMGLRDSTRKLLRKLSSRDKKQEEVNQLQPVALAGASKRSTHRSELCSTFAATAVSREELEGRRKAMSEGSADWEQCGMCTRSFVAGTSRYAGFCSLDCKSAALYSQSARVYRGRYRNA
ncbi:hypothetical protein GN244_ATG05930 [Phytophthora infestans]|uniref:Uncharacterized protein n=1 Tax=Phytophthora infestans TaxID=4787 RepID=A0A833TFA9_PHYIN|nr:hypothetical protein GN244_ATG05930 [Phytophthora infestans]